PFTCLLIHTHHPPTPTPFPYTTLFRSNRGRTIVAGNRAPFGNPPTPEKAGPAEIRGLGAQRKTIAAHRHDFSRRAPVADGHARAHVRFARRRGCRGPEIAEALQPGNVGRRDVRCFHALLA